jgi:hypothetical protein
MCGTASPGQQRSNRQLPLRGEVKPYFGKPTIFINDSAYSPMIYALTDVPGGRWSTDEIPQLNIKLFAEIGVKLYQVDIFLDHIWLEDGSFTLERAKKQIRGVLEVCPDAGIIFRFHVNPPKWWIRQHPEDCVKYDNAEARPDAVPANRQLIFHDAGLAERASLASAKWIESSTQKLQQFCREFSKTEEGDHLIGIQVASGIYGEWHMWGLLHWEADFSEPMRLHFSEWAKNKYGTVAALRRAWNDPAIDFAAITVPTTAEREKVSAGIFRDPAKDRKVIDYYTCQHEMVGADVLHFCKTVKESWPRPIITGSFYGYFFSVFNRLAAGAQLDIEPVLRSPYIDYLCSPQTYEPESYLTGEPYRSRSLITSVLLHKKLWLDEMDQQPRRVLPFNYKDDENPEYNNVISENVAQITRNVMFSHSKGMGLWFYDFGPAGSSTHPDSKSFPAYCQTGYWDHPRYLASIHTLKGIIDNDLKTEYTSEADVLLVYDTKTQFHLMSTGKADPVSGQTIDWTSLNSFYAGVVFDPVHISDLDKVDFTKYKIVVFGNSFVVDAKTKELIRTKIAKGGRHLLWIYAPAYSTGDSLSDANVEAVTGMRLKKTVCSVIPKVEISSAVGDVPVQSPKGVCAPLYSIDDPAAVIFGTYQHDGSPAFGKKTLDSCTSWFIGVPPVDYHLLKFIYRSAGVNIYDDEKDIFYGGAGIITMHTKSGGKKSVHLKNGKTVIVDLPHTPATVLINSTTGEIMYEGR